MHYFFMIIPAAPKDYSAHGERRVLRDALFKKYNNVFLKIIKSLFYLQKKYVII